MTCVCAKLISFLFFLLLLGKQNFGCAFRQREKCRYLVSQLTHFVRQERMLAIVDLWVLGNEVISALGHFHCGVVLVLLCAKQRRCKAFS